MESKKTLDFLLIRSAYFLLIVIGILSTSNLNTVISSTTLSGIDLILAIIIAVNAIINLFRMGRISSKLFYFLGLIFFSLVLSLIFKSYSIVLLYLCGISAFNFSSRELVKIYFCSTFIGVVVSAMFGILGIINFSNLGFTSKNAIGFFIFSECLLYFYLNSDFKKIIKVFILLILFFIEFFVVKDRTAGILSIIYLVIVLNKRMLKNKLTVTLSFVLAIVSMFLGEKFTLDSGWMNSLNKALSNRLLFWNFNLNQYGIKFFPQNIETINVLLNDGSFTTNYLDNGYLNFLIGIGYFQTIILLLILCVAIERVIIQNKYNELVIIVIFLIYAFTEKIVFSPICCILFPLCFLEIKSSYGREMN
ncbi:hypothetical protein AAA410_09490 [Lactobacillus crispatus]|jgi:hypothetical protein|uniref:Polysaccharide polymerase n=5 Tax=Lactobacillus crispatus TaxID=47770 RepID=A0A4R6CQX5_9LACO|nr:hypothetical protein [Lactobacillus crispatus]EEX28811.1 hypothetical protein HMPREF0508_01777 [Lactobacillus crispatus MV-3A-US]KWU10942.1 hypothetical protein AEL98_04205 [Lactobacillus crispatus]MCT3536539.1 hypothetical protein [Lactobacillus crispatus]MCT7711789.1 hypothetical protein [Lactobacillus crispatus]MCT7713838.1 hypothetical protein [Lactobacillus crispatus]